MTNYKAVKINGAKHDEHRIIMERHIGRKLDRNEIIHHINGDKWDNRIENLQIMTRAEHSRMHQTGRKASKETLEKISLANKGNLNGTPRKLSYDDIQYIRNNYIPRDKDFGVRALSRKFNITHSKISRIISRKSYRDMD